jgi:hypothetical protein
MSEIRFGVGGASHLHEADCEFLCHKI